MFEELNNKLRAASIEELKQIISSAGMPSDAQQIASKELETLSTISPGTVKYDSVLNYISYLISLPWKEKTDVKPDLQRIVEILNESQHCSQNIRERILKHLAVKLLNDYKNPKILVVDDEKIALESLEHILTQEGYTVVLANNGAEAIEKLKASDFDVVLTDLVMGEVDGNAVIKETKSKYPDTKIIMITGYATVDTAVEAIREGAFNYIEKPIKLDEVRSVVKDALKQKMSARKRTFLCFAGSSGTDKASLGQTIAEALGRKLLRISLSGMKDESEIRGQSRMTDGAMPGRIIEEIRCAGVADPVFMLDGIDMVEGDFKDNIASALLEVLDPRKNHDFIDRYIDVPFNLSNVMFIVSTNDADNIQGHLRDFLEIIEI
jgi:ATP-dependent Lon protease